MKNKVIFSTIAAERKSATIESIGWLMIALGICCNLVSSIVRNKNRVSYEK